MKLIKYQVFDETKFPDTRTFVGIRISYEDETKEETRQRLIRDEGMGKDVELFSFKVVCPEESL